MSKEHFVISGVRVKPGESKQIDFSFARLPSRTQINVPLFVFRAKKKGPVLLITAGVHGDELNGVESIRQLITKDLLQPDRGTVITVPVVNVFSFLYGKRELPDGRDLNRCFPGSKTGSLGSRLAYRIMTDIMPVVDYGIDFHTGGANRSNFPQIRCSFTDEENIELAKAVQTRFVVNAANRDKSMRKSAFDHGKRILVFEGGESMRFDSRSISEGVGGCLRLMRHLGMKEKAPDPYYNTDIVSSSTWIRAKSAGLFHTIKKNGDAIQKNEVIGKITDPYGDFTTNIITSHSGFIIGTNNQPLVNQGDALINVGYQ